MRRAFVSPAEHCPSVVTGLSTMTSGWLKEFAGEVLGGIRRHDRLHWQQSEGKEPAVPSTNRASFLSSRAKPRDLQFRLISSNTEGSPLTTAVAEGPAVPATPPPDPQLVSTIVEMNRG